MSETQFVPPREYALHQIDIDEFFGESESQSVDFEIIFAATVSSITFTSYAISPVLHSVAKVAGATLLIATLARRLSLTGKFSRRDQIMVKTMPPIFYATVYCCIYFLSGISAQLGNLLPLSQHVFLGMSLIVGPLVLIAVYEGFYRDYILWASLRFYNVYVENRGNFLGELISPMLGEIVAKSQADVEQYRSLVTQISTNNTSTDPPLEYFGSVLGVLLAVIVAGALLIGGAIPLKIMTPFNWLESVALGLPVGFGAFLLAGTLQFVYARHGYNRFVDISGWRFTVFPVLLAYAFVAAVSL